MRRGMLMTIRALALAALLLPALAEAQHQRRRSIPEFDPASAGAIAALVAGGGVYLARRRR